MMGQHLQRVPQGLEKAAEKQLFGSAVIQEVAILSRATAVFRASLDAPAFLSAACEGRFKYGWEGHG